MVSPPWLRNWSQAFRAHRLKQSGWSVELNRDRLRVVSAGLPLRPGESPGQVHKRRSYSLTAPPGPATATAALSKASSVFDSVVAGTWRWPDPAAALPAEDPRHLPAEHLEPKHHRLGPVATEPGGQWQPGIAVGFHDDGDVVCLGWNPLPESLKILRAGSKADVFQSKEPVASAQAARWTARQATSMPILMAINTFWCVVKESMATRP